MNEWRRRRVVLALVLVASLLGGMAQLDRIVGAQSGTPVPGAQTWQIQVDNLSPPGYAWGFNAFYPDHLRAHPGDTLVFTLAANPGAVHTVHLLALGLTPLEWYSGFSAGFLQPDLSRPGKWQRPFFNNEAASLGLPATCGRAGQRPCPFNQDKIQDVQFGLSSSVLVNPPPSGGQGNTSFAITLDPTLHPGAYYVMSDVDGPTMSGRIDVVPSDQPVQRPEDLHAAAERQYAADLAWLSGRDRIANPPEAANPDGTKTWQVDAGSGSADKPWLSINAFSPSQMTIVAGDTVTWTNKSPGAVAHTVTGFAADAATIPQNLSPYQPGCMTSAGELTTPAAGTFPPDIWTTCPGAEVNNLTEFSQPSAPSGDAYKSGPWTSGILLNQAYLDSPIGDGLPYASSYSVKFANPGTYYYASATDPGMIGVVVVIPKPMPF